MKPNTASPFLFLVLALTAFVMPWQPITEHHQVKPEMPCASFDVSNTLSRSIKVTVGESVFRVSGRTSSHFKLYGKCVLTDVGTQPGQLVAQVEGNVSRIQKEEVAYKLH